MDELEKYLKILEKKLNHSCKNIDDIDENEEMKIFINKLYGIRDKRNYSTIRCPRWTMKSMCLEENLFGDKLNLVLKCYFSSHEVYEYVLSNFYILVEFKGACFKRILFNENLQMLMNPTNYSLSFEEMMEIIIEKRFDEKNYVEQEKYLITTL